MRSAFFSTMSNPLVEIFVEISPVIHATFKLSPTFPNQPPRSNSTHPCIYQRVVIRVINPPLDTTQYLHITFHASNFDTAPSSLIP
jgi:hypothetical protein